MAYNRYNANTGSYKRVPEPPSLGRSGSRRLGSVGEQSARQPDNASADGNNNTRPPNSGSAGDINAHTPRRYKGSRPAGNGGAAGLLGGIEKLLPSGLDAGDLALAALLFLLYVESGDEDFLIMLIVTGASIFKDIGSGGQ